MMRTVLSGHVGIQHSTELRASKHSPFSAPASLGHMTHM